jgi:sulfoxide reductase catalytic subunit YedY
MVFPKKHLYGDDIPSSQITPMPAFRNNRPTRRGFLASAAAIAAGGLLPAAAFADNELQTVPGKYQATDTQTPFSKATTFNNFYEFGEDKSEPAKNAHTLRTRPWSIKVSGLVKKPQTINIDDLIHYRPLESRVYRHRCVEAWSMVIPWDGFSLSEFINFCEPLPSAKYIQFLSLEDRKQMPDIPYGFDWPYSEGLRMDEAMHPLTLLTFGCYGQVLPNQNGAPVRVVLPWKWGYKSAKSIVEFKFTKDQPRTLWNEANPEEYGFYSNVNPNINHRWSQARERRIDSSPFPHSIATQMFNGYGDQVAGLYAGMDLTRYY